MRSKHRTLGFCLCLILLIIQMPPMGNIAYFLGFIGIFTLCFHAIYQKNDKFNVNLISIFAFLYIIYGLFGIFHSEIPYLTIKMMPTYLLLPIIVLFAAMTKDDNGDDFVSMTIISKFLTICGAILSLYAIWQIYNQSGYFRTISNYPFYNPNSLAVFLGICLLATFNNIVKDDRSSPIYYFLLALILAGIYTTASKAVFIMSLIMLIIMAATYIKIVSNKDYKKLFITSISIVLTMIIVPILYQTIVTSNGQVGHSIIPDIHSANTRLAIWQGAIQTIFSTHPLIGNGIGTYKEVYLQYRLPADKSSGNHAHNDFLHIWVEMGIAGLIIFTIGVIGFFKALRQIIINSDFQSILSASIILFCGGMAMVTPIIFLSPVIFIVALCLVSLMPKNTRQFKYGDYLRQILMVILVFICLLTARNFAESLMSDKAKSAMDRGDFKEFLLTVDGLDKISFGLSPAVPIYRVSSLLAMYDGGLLPNDQKSKALDEMTTYIDDAEYRNPYNSEILYYRGEVAMRSGNKAEAIKYWQDTIALDPSYVVARMKLINLSENQDDKMALIREGIGLKYWQQNPIKFYATALIEAEKLEDKDLILFIQNKIQANLNKSRN